MRRISFIAAAVLVLCAFGATQVVSSPSVQKLNHNSSIDWTNLIYVATGEGVMPSAKDEPNRARAYLKAKGYARMAAIANLLAAIEGTTISFEAVGRDYMEDATIRQTIEGYVKNVEVTKTSKETLEGDTIVIVEVRAPMFGQSGPGSVLLNQEMKKPSEITVETSIKVTLKPDAQVTSTVEPPKPAQPSKPYTSVIVDTAGYKLDRCMSPKIRRADGSEVWGSVKADPDLVLERGICSYVTSMADARQNQRCGTNPLVIRAIGRAGGRFNSDPVISDSDAQLLLAENANSGFLGKMNVIIVKDGRL